jgi:succinate dehydrogenase/fumarate reductase flavoprotein subunit
VKSLIVEGDAVVGATVMQDGKPLEIRVRRGVVLACGGFPYDVERRKQLFPHAPTGHEHFTPSPALNTGDGLRLGESVGGWVDPTIPNAAAWCPTSVTKRKDGSEGVMPHFIDRAKPGAIAVTPKGRRFTNEALSYHDFIQDLVKACKDLPEVTCWLICDHKHLREYGLGAVAPFPLPIGKHLKNGYLKRGNSLQELAKAIGVPYVALQEEVESFNRDAAKGVDTKFGKGSTAYNRFQGDSLVTPNPCMAPIRQGPYYAIKIVVGEIGTFAGLLTDDSCQVLTQARQPVKGLYAVGNDAASIMGGNYPGAGITLGPALTFGYVVGNALANQTKRLATADVVQLATPRERVRVA